MKLGLFKINDGGKFSGDNVFEADFEQSKKVVISGDSGSG